MWYPTLVESRDGTPREDPMARARSLTEFQSAFPDEASCSAFLFERRWPDGFVCPACGQGRAAALKSRAYTYECSDCGRQTSITAGTALHRTKLPLTAWFWAAHLTWDDLPWLRSLTKLPLILKGVCHPDDVQRAIDGGVDGIYCSNHGGRQANGGIASLDMLPAVVKAAGTTPVLFDSGVRSG